MDFDVETKSLLVKSGWNRNRLIDTNEYENYLKLCGYSVFPEVKRFLQEFGGLQVSPNEQVGERISYRLKVDPIDLLQSYSSNIIDEFQELLKRPICPIALALNGTAAIVMDESGKIYDIEGLVLFYVANNIPDAMRIICCSNLSETQIIAELD